MLTGVQGHPISRRSFVQGATLAGLSAAALAACTPGSDSPAPMSSSADPDAGIRDDAAARERVLIALYDAAIVAHPDLASDLTAIRDEHAAHADALAPAPASGSPAVPSAGSAAAALKVLTEAERLATAERTASCEGAASQDLAQLLALIAASEAGHAEYLRRLA